MGTPERRRGPLTPQQQALVETAEPWLRQEATRAPACFARLHGAEGVAQEARLAACKAAADFDPVRFPGVPFGAFARERVRRHLRGLVCRAAPRLCVWGAFPVGAEVADHRGTAVSPALRAWCSEEYRRQRRGLHWRERVVLYLRYVESWTLAECGAYFGLSSSCVELLAWRAVKALGARRVQLADQLRAAPAGREIA